MTALSVVREREPQAVYNLTVADVPEYFANGLLVHNCDAMRYLCRSGGAKAIVDPAAVKPPVVDEVYEYAIGGSQGHTAWMGS